MRSSAWRASWSYHLRHLRSSGALRLAGLLSVGTAVVGGFAAFTGDVTGAEVASTLGWATWAAVFASSSALSQTTSARSSTLLTARGLDARARQFGDLSARGTWIAAAFGFPAMVIALGLLSHARSPKEAVMTLLSVLGLLGCAITLSLCLVTLGLLSRSLTVRRPGGVLLLLVVAPDVLKQALPQVPSVLALQSWLVNMSLRGI